MTTVYVRVCDYGYEGETIRFATVDPETAFNYFSAPNMSYDDTGLYAPDDLSEEVRVYEKELEVDKWHRRRGQWVKGYGEREVVYGVIKGREG